MVTAALSDALSHPIHIVRELQAQHGTSSTPFPSVVKKHFQSLFGSTANLQKIPPLDVHHPPSSFPSGSLVHFRAMVQDTSASPEIYVSHLGYGLDSVPQPNGNGNGASDLDKPFDLHTLQDALDSGFGSGGRERERWRERTVFWAVGVPGESAWVGKALDGTHPSSITPSASSGSSMAHKFPLPDTAHVGALVKSYGTSEFKPSAVHDFVGILTFDARLSLGLLSSADPDGDDDALLPALHVLFHAPVPTTLVRSVYPMPPARGRTSGQVKRELVAWLADAALGGDGLAAEYVLMSCVARVQSRTPALLPPSLLLSHFPAALLSPSPSPTDNHPPAPPLQSALQQLFPLVAPLPLSIAYMNDTPFAPSSSARDDSEDLRSGALQLAPGTVVLVSEHGVGEGKLGDLGVRNIATLQSALTAQTLAYAFPFSAYEFPLDLAFVVLCEGSKSPFVTTEINLPLQPSSPAPAPPPTLSDDQLSEYRLWLAGAKAHAGHKASIAVSREMAEHIQSEFVRERKEAGERSGGEKEGVTSEDLGRRMTLAKLMALLRHEESLTREIWEEVGELESRRKKRLAGQ